MSLTMILGKTIDGLTDVQDPYPDAYREIVINLSDGSTLRLIGIGRAVVEPATTCPTCERPLK